MKKKYISNTLLGLGLIGASIGLASCQTTEAPIETKSQMSAINLASTSNDNIITPLATTSNVTATVDASYINIMESRKMANFQYMNITPGGTTITPLTYSNVDFKDLSGSSFKSFAFYSDIAQIQESVQFYNSLNSSLHATSLDFRLDFECEAFDYKEDDEWVTAHNQFSVYMYFKINFNSQYKVSSLESWYTCPTYDGYGEGYILETVDLLSIDVAYSGSTIVPTVNDCNPFKMSYIPYKPNDCSVDEMYFWNDYDRVYVNANVNGSTVSLTEIDDTSGDYGYDTGDPVYSNCFLRSFGYFSHSEDVDVPYFQHGTTFVTDYDNPITFDTIKKQLKATDYTEGDLTSKIVITNNTYTLVNGKIDIGTYSFNATVSDSSGNTTTSQFYVRVVDSQAPVVTYNGTVTIGNDRQYSMDEILELANVKVVDNHDSFSDLEFYGSWSGDGDYSTDWMKVGNDCELEFDYYDTSGNSDGNYYIVLNIVDTTPPTLTGVAKTTGNNACLSQAELLALFPGSDDVSSIITKEIIADNYTSNYKKVGSYTVTCKATDEAGNTTTATTTIKVTDNTKPTITGATVNQSYTTLRTDLKGLFTIADETTSTANLKLAITTDNYSSNYSTLGSYTVTATVTDEAGNSSTATATIKVVDDVKPIITVPSGLTASTTDPLTIDELRSYITVIDSIDGAITNFTIADHTKYFENQMVVGEHGFTVNVTDTAGNTASASFVLTVVDRDYPQFSWDNTYTINVDSNVTLTQDMLIEILISSGQIESKQSIMSLSSTYFTSPNEEGEYELVIELSNGNTITNTIKSVSYEEELEDTTNDSFITKLSDLYKNYTIPMVIGTVLVVGFIFALAVILLKKIRRH